VFDQIKKYWSTIDTNHTNVELKATTDYKLPKYAEGIFVTSGPSKYEMGPRKFNQVLDGYGRFTSVNFKDGKATMNSKLINSPFYKESTK